MLLSNNNKKKVNKKFQDKDAFSKVQLKVIKKSTDVYLKLDQYLSTKVEVKDEMVLKVLQIRLFKDMRHIKNENINKTRSIATHLNLE